MQQMAIQCEACIFLNNLHKFAICDTDEVNVWMTQTLRVNELSAKRGAAQTFCIYKKHFVLYVHAVLSAGGFNHM